MFSPLHTRNAETETYNRSYWDDMLLTIIQIGKSYIVISLAYCFGYILCLFCRTAPATPGWLKRCM